MNHIRITVYTFFLLIQMFCRTKCDKNHFFTMSIFLSRKRGDFVEDNVNFLTMFKLSFIKTKRYEFFSLHVSTSTADFIRKLSTHC